MSFPMGVLCLFLGGVFVWVGSHGTNATSPWALFQQVLAGFSGQGTDVTRPADPWDAVGSAAGAAAADAAAQAVGAAGANAAGGGAVHTGSGSSSHRSSSHRSSLNLPGGDTHSADQDAINRILNTPDTTASDRALAAAAQHKIDQIEQQLGQLGH